MTTDETGERSVVTFRRLVTNAVRGRRRVLIGVLVAGLVCVALVVAAGVVRWPDSSHRAGGRGAGATTAVETVAVSRGDLSTDQTLSGTFGYGAAQTLKGHRDGTITWLPTVGTVVERGQPVYRIDDEPVVLFVGAVPLYRTLSARNTVGRDVRMVADNLKALGYSIGSQPAVGESVVQDATPPDAALPGAAPPAAGMPPAAAPPSGAAAPDGSKQPAARTGSSGSTQVTVREGDGVLTAALRGAIGKWQTDHGVASTGVLHVGDLVVLPGPVRVNAVPGAVGEPAGAPQLAVTSTAKVVTLSINVADAGAIRENDAVAVILPDGRTTPGKVAAIAAAAQASGSGGDAGSPQKLTVTVSFDDPAAVGTLDSTSVKVRFTAETKHGVLLVPIGALLALREGGYAVQLDGGGLVAVTVGLIVKGMAEISGAVTEGTRVVTTS